jgi:hypothetical protein
VSLLREAVERAVETAWEDGRVVPRTPADHQAVMVEAVLRELAWLGMGEDDYDGDHEAEFDVGRLVRLQHPLSCRREMDRCRVSRAVEARRIDTPDRGPGRYAVALARDRLVFEPLRTGL